MLYWLDSSLATLANSFGYQRLTPKAKELGLIDDERWAAFQSKYAAAELEQKRLKSTWIQADDSNFLSGNFSLSNSCFGTLLPR